MVILRTLWITFNRFCPNQKKVSLLCHITLRPCIKFDENCKQRVLKILTVNRAIQMILNFVRSKMTTEATPKFVLRLCMSRSDFPLLDGLLNIRWGMTLWDLTLFILAYSSSIKVKKLRESHISFFFLHIFHAYFHFGGIEPRGIHLFHKELIWDEAGTWWIKRYCMLLHVTCVT